MNALVDASQYRRYILGVGYESLLVPVYPERSVAPCEYEGRLFRISAGLEDADDLIDDLKRGFAALRVA